MNLLTFVGEEQEQIAERASLLHIALLDSNSETNPYLKTIFGAGVDYHPDEKRLVQVLLVDSPEEEGPGKFLNIFDDNDTLYLVRAALGRDLRWLEEIYVCPQPAPDLQLKVGDRISSNKVGTTGAGVSWHNGKLINGFLTAGHVAPNGSYVHRRGIGSSRSQHVGTTRHCGFRTGYPNMPIADVSVVELKQNQPVTPSFRGTSAAKANDAVYIHGPIRQPKAAKVMGFCTFVYVPKINATLGNCYFTTRHATRAGYSGATVSDKKNSSVIGIVVAGTRRFTTYVQSIDYVISSVPQNSKGLHGINIV